MADLSSQESIRELAGQFTSRHQRLHVLVNNAGYMGWDRRETIDGLEMTFAVNHLAPFLLTHLLLEPLQKAAEDGGEGRVVNISSSAQRMGRIDLTGLFYGDYRQPGIASRQVNNRELARQLWDISARLTHISPTLTIN